MKRSKGTSTPGRTLRLRVSTMAIAIVLTTPALAQTGATTAAAEGAKDSKGGTANQIVDSITAQNIGASLNNKRTRTNQVSSGIYQRQTLSSAVGSLPAGTQVYTPGGLGLSDDSKARAQMPSHAQFLSESRWRQSA